MLVSTSAVLYDLGLIVFLLLEIIYLVNELLMIHLAISFFLLIVVVLHHHHLVWRYLLRAAGSMTRSRIVGIGSKDSSWPSLILNHHCNLLN